MGGGGLEWPHQNRPAPWGGIHPILKSFDEGVEFWHTIEDPAHKAAATVPAKEIKKGPLETVVRF